MSKNPREGSTLRSLFEELGEWDEVEARVEKRMIAEALRRAMTEQNVTKSELAKRMDTSRSQVDAILDGDDAGLTLLTLSRASYALGLRPEIRFTSREVVRPEEARAKVRPAPTRRRPPRTSAATGRSAG